jgi:hypothetical protein
MGVCAHAIGTRMKVTKTTMIFLGRLETSFLHIHSVINRDGKGVFRLADRRTGVVGNGHGLGSMIGWVQRFPHATHTPTQGAMIIRELCFFFFFFFFFVWLFFWSLNETGARRGCWGEGARVGSTTMRCDAMRCDANETCWGNTGLCILRCALWNRNGLFTFFGSCLFVLFCFFHPG